MKTPTKKKRRRQERASVQRSVSAMRLLTSRLFATMRAFGWEPSRDDLRIDRLETKWLDDSELQLMNGIATPCRCCPRLRRMPATLRRDARPLPIVGLLARVEARR